MSSALEDAKRAHIDNLRKSVEQMICKNPESERDVILHKDSQSKIATICIKSPAKNALSGKMICQLTDVLDALHQWKEGKVVLICGYDNTFCSGSDLVGARATANQESGLDLAEIMQYNLMRLQTLHMVSVAYLEGYSLGGGAELAMGADLRIMTESARIGFVHVKVGVCCGWGGASRLVQLVGPSRAIDILSSGRSIRADEALRIGLCNAIVTSEEEARAYVLARSIGSQHVIRNIKAVINSAREHKFATALAIEGHLYASTWGTDEHLAKLDANIKHNEG